MGTTVILESALIEVLLIKGTQYENCFDFRFRFVHDFQSDQRGSYG